ncbi:hypothetical protein GU90_17135 [Saccharopolyspora rectivirgula]|uniref:Lsr2 dimerization domain-containing protein n=2 Tax=Saccharopolyspora rectivirgula TaxID=28042 RepID=A0A073B709_9PSEU|nr:hypothetical protein GU90_17135 [Saccharopolyspora rectivirgula]
MIMAERIQVELVDDIDGSPAQHTITFALDGVTYEIDLNDRHARQLRSTLERYIKRGRKKAQRASRGSKQREREEKRARRVNRQLTEQIRGAAQRTREHLNRKAAEEQAQPEPETAEQSGPTAEDQPLFEAPAEKPGKKEQQRIPAVVMPQFSSAAD